MFDDLLNMYINDVKKELYKKKSPYCFSYTEGNTVAIVGKKILSVIENKDNDCITEINTRKNVMQIKNISKKSECLFICGPRGAGKSTYISNYVKYYNKIFPYKDVILFSEKNEDDIFQRIKFKRVILNEEMIENPIKVEELENSLVVFDDIDSIKNTKLNKEVYDLIDNIIKLGRSKHIDIIISYHMISNYSKTRTILFNCDTITIFPGTGSINQFRNLFWNYIGIDKKQTKKILELNSRWVTIFKNVPRIVLYQHGAYFL